MRFANQSESRRVLASDIRVKGREFATTWLRDIEIGIFNSDIDSPVGEG
jgi:hypothetical protein